MFTEVGIFIYNPFIETKAAFWTDLIQKCLYFITFALSRESAHLGEWVPFPNRDAIAVFKDSGSTLSKMLYAWKFIWQD